MGSDRAIRAAAVVAMMLAGCAKQEAAKPAAPTAPGAAAVEKLEVEKATGPDARGVAEIFAQRKELAGKPVAVRGRVVKFSANILGGNWAHVRDGSGSDATKDNDLTVKTGDVTAVGETVLVRGTVALDRDLGAGYFYPVLIEDAKLEK